MKIHESMNVSLHKKLRFLLLASVFWLGALTAQAQSPTIDIIEVTVLKNDTFSFAPIEHYSVAYYPEIKNGGAVNGKSFFDPYTWNRYKFGIKSPGGTAPGINHLFYAPDTDFIGHDEITVLYYKSFGNGNSIAAYNIYKITVVPSYLYAENDYASTDENVSIEIDVLDNDFGNGTNLTVAEITNVNSGTAVTSSGDTKITFTPDGGFNGVAHLNYTICDAEGSCDMATVSICVNDLNPPAYDSVFVTTEKNAEQVILMEMDSNFVITQFPTKGSVDTFETLTYIPDTDSIGYDKVIFEDATNNRTRVFQIRILDVPTPNILLFDDVVYTPVGETIEEIHLLANDNGGAYLTSVGANNYPVTAKLGQLTYLPQIGKGVYKYVPPVGFSGIDYFTYHAYAPNSGYSETATCYIVVEDLDPELPVIHAVTPQNTPLVLGDHLPFPSYEYEVVSNADLGDVNFHAGYQTVTSQHGQTFSGNNMLVYDPDAGALGTDEFEVYYCPGNQTSNCPLVKVVVDIVTISNPQSDTLCAGSQCVWSGDADHNGKVDIRDLLPIGLCMGEVGENRPSGSISWYGQYSDNWNSLVATSLGFDVKHIDTDGNGIVSAVDTAAISQFYGNYHNLTPAPVDPISPLPFYIDTDSLINIEPGAVIYAPIHLGNDSIPAFDAYGLTFEIEYDPALFESVKIFWSDTAWMQYNSPVLSMVHSPFEGKLDAGYTRTSGVSASGYGHLGVAEFIVIDDISGNRPNSLSSTVNFKSAGLMGSNGETMGLSNNSITFIFDTEEEKTDIESTETKLTAFPNPSSSQVNVSMNGQMERISMYNTMGQQVYDSGSISSKYQRLDVSGLAPGVYLLKAWSNGEVFNEKVEVVR